MATNTEESYRKGDGLSSTLGAGGTERHDIHMLSA